MISVQNKSPAAWALIPLADPDLCVTAFQMHHIVWVQFEGYTPVETCPAKKQCEHFTLDIFFILCVVYTFDKVQKTANHCFWKFYIVLWNLLSNSSIGLLLLANIRNPYWRRRCSCISSWATLSIRNTSMLPTAQIPALNTCKTSPQNIPLSFIHRLMSPG